jgi:hypothetical protein
MTLHGVYQDAQGWRVVLRIDGKRRHLGCYGLLFNALICANYHIAWLNLGLPWNDIRELAKAHPVLIAQKPKRRRDLAAS